MTSQPALAQLPGPLDAERSELVARVVEGLDAPSLQWLSGFAAGVAYERAQGGRPRRGPAGARVAGGRSRLAVIYGSQTGNGKVSPAPWGGGEAGVSRCGQSARTTPQGSGEGALLVVVMRTTARRHPDDARALEYLTGSARPGSSA